MAGRAATTLLLVTSHAIARLDLTRSQKVAGYWWESRPGADGLALLADTAMHLGPRRVGRQVYVISSDVSVQQIELIESAATGVSSKALANALSFEAEPVSGVSAFDSAIGWRSLGSNAGYRGFVVTQSQLSALDSIEVSIKRAGGRLKAIMHPSAVPVRLAAAINPVDGGDDASIEKSADTEKTGSWSRIEHWAGISLGLHSNPDGTIKLNVFRSDPRSSRFQAEVEDWVGQTGAATHEELLAESTSLVPGGGGQAAALGGAYTSEVERTVMVLDNQEACGQWMQAWADALTAGKAAAVPSIKPPRRPMSAPSRWAIAASLAIIAGVGCYGYHSVLTHRDGKLKAELDRVSGPAQRLAAIEASSGEVVTRLNSTRDEVAALRDDVEVCTEVFQTFRYRWARLLDLLAKHRPSRLMIQRIEGQGGEATIHGMCLESQLANEYALSLALDLEPYGWLVEPAAKEAMVILPDGGPWKFRLPLRMLERPNSLTAPTRNTGPAPGGWLLNDFQTQQGGE